MKSTCGDCQPIVPVENQLNMNKKKRQKQSICVKYARFKYKNW